MRAAAVYPLTRFQLPASSSSRLLSSSPLRHFRSRPLVASMSSSTEGGIHSQNQRWKPLCLYHTQEKCAMMDDQFHIQKFNHDFAKDLRCDDTASVSPQQMDYFLVLDLEGKVEILEFPVLLIDAKTLGFVDLFHRFVRPSKMSDQRINEYIEGKYGKFGVDRVWHDTAISFNDVIDQFEGWLNKHHLWLKEEEGTLHRAAFVTCGNWDLKTKVPQQCKVSRMSLPPYFMEWINLKDVYLNFYHREARGMMAMMKQLGIPAYGSHHLGIDDTKNIARVLQRILLDGAIVKITARRDVRCPEKVRFLLENRIR